tara:strand:- start:297 stop:2168 length:1872 start_codon:yes stop_codon:yes gene_type:complete
MRGLIKYMKKRFKHKEEVVSDGKKKPPVVTLNKPIEGFKTNSEITFNCSITSKKKLKSVSLYGDWGNGWEEKVEYKPKKGEKKGGDFLISYSDNILGGAYEWNCEACTKKDCVFGSSNRSISVDGTAPGLVSYSNTTTNETTQVNWVTDEASTTNLYYGQTVSDSSLVTEHSVNLNGLSNNTLYDIIITACDVAGNCITYSGAFTTTQNDFSDNEEPTIGGVGSTVTNETGIVSWTTNELSNSSLDYGDGFVSSSNLVTSHSLLLSNLINNIVYHYNLSSCDFSGNCGSYSGSFTTSQNVYVDNIKPVVTILSPRSKVMDDDGVIPFSFQVNDDSSISNCSIIANDKIWRTFNDVPKIVKRAINLSLKGGKYLWHVKCIDSAGNEGVSEQRVLLSYYSISKFLGKTTDLTNVSNLSKVRDFIVESPNIGRIKFLEELDLRNGVDFNKYVKISPRKIEINSSEMPALNKSATLYMYNLTVANPKIMRDGVECPSSICTIVSYVNGTLEFTVTQFSVYEIVETEESSPSNSGGGSSGGGGGSSGGSSKTSDPNLSEEGLNGSKSKDNIEGDVDDGFVEETKLFEDDELLEKSGITGFAVVIGDNYLWDFFVSCYFDCVYFGWVLF